MKYYAEQSSTIVPFLWLVHLHVAFRAEKCKKHARTLREYGAPKVSKMAAILIFLFSTIYYATADILVSSNNYPTQEDSCRCNLALTRFFYCFLNFKKDLKPLMFPRRVNKSPLRVCYCHRHFYKKRLYKQTPEYLRSRAQPWVGK